MALAYQTIIWDNVGLLSIGLPGTDMRGMSNEMQHFFVLEHTYFLI